MDPETLLMSRIRHVWGSLIYAATRTSSVPAAFLAALVANESRGNSAAERFEPQVFVHLAGVALGGPNYSPPGIKRPLDARNVLKFCAPLCTAPTPPLPSNDTVLALNRLKWLATSFGLTQIMGWHAIEFDLPPLDRHFPDLVTPAGNFRTALLLLAWFAEHYGLALDREFPQLFHCWNTGDPKEQTSDPNYVAHGLRRLQIYQQLERGDPT